MKKYAEMLVTVLALLLVLITSVVTYPDYSKINYRNSDATWHTLLTMTAYKETPASEHLFLPIISLGRADDKGITWGSTLPDANGNYYYTSFSPAGFMAPYLFCRAFHLEFTEQSLFVFNKVILMISLIVLVHLIVLLFEGSKYKYFLAFCAVLIYIFEPEMFHSTGVTYWHQELFQFFFLLQLTAFVRMGSQKKAQIGFFLLAVFNPYLEWTGYIANAGFVLAFLLACVVEKEKKAIWYAIGTVGATFSAGILFVLHYLTRLDRERFFATVLQRYDARKYNGSAAIGELLRGYKVSFYAMCYIGILFAIVISVIKVFDAVGHGEKGAIGKELYKRCIIAIVVCVPLLENLVMLHHAIAYTYDRMKLIIPICLFCCDALNQILIRKMKLISITAAAGIVLACGINLYQYQNEDCYTWEVSYRNSNLSLAKKVAEYDDAVLGAPQVRGYCNMLFESGVYEGMAKDTVDELIKIAKDKGKRYVILLEWEKNDPQQWNLYDFTDAIVYDMQNISNPIRLLP